MISYILLLLRDNEIQVSPDTNLKLCSLCLSSAHVYKYYVVYGIILVFITTEESTRIFTAQPNVFYSKKCDREKCEDWIFYNAKKQCFHQRGGGGGGGLQRKKNALYVHQVANSQLLLIS